MRKTMTIVSLPRSDGQQLWEDRMSAWSVRLIHQDLS